MNNISISKSDLNLASLYQNLISSSQNFSQKTRKFNPTEHKDKTRAKIALIFVVCFFCPISYFINFCVCLQWMDYY